MHAAGLRAVVPAKTRSSLPPAGDVWLVRLVCLGANGTARGPAWSISRHTVPCVISEPERTCDGSCEPYLATTAPTCSGRPSVSGLPRTQVQLGNLAQRFYLAVELDLQAQTPSRVGRKLRACSLRVCGWFDWPELERLEQKKRDMAVREARKFCRRVLNQAGVHEAFAK